MECLKSSELKDDDFKFALEICTSKNQYYVSPEEAIPWSDEERQQRQLGYYHWVPIVLTLQALFFALPNLLWNYGNGKSGIDLAFLVDEAIKLRKLNLTNKERPDKVDELATRIKDALGDTEDTLGRMQTRRIGGFRFGKSLGYVISYFYIAIKLLYLLNVAAQ